MKRVYIGIIAGISLLFLLVTGCNRNRLDVDISGMELELDIARFDRELFTMDLDTVNQAVSYFYNQYGDFYDVFNVHVINIGPASQKHYGSYLSMFVNDPQNREVYRETQQVFPTMEPYEEELEKAFKRYLHHFPDSAAPSVVAFVSRFNHKLFTVSRTIGVGLDQYLGRDSRYYDRLRTPEYMQYNQYPGKIPTDVAHVWGTALFPYNDSLDNVLSRMVYQGILLYFTEALLPDAPDHVKIGFRPEQLAWCEENEQRMWEYLVENDLLFSSDPLDIKKLTEDAPYTYYFSRESPGKAAVWIGWQIVRKYARRNPGLPVREIFTETDYQEILRESRYSP